MRIVSMVIVPDSGAYEDIFRHLQLHSNFLVQVSYYGKFERKGRQILSWKTEKHLKENNDPRTNEDCKGLKRSTRISSDKLDAR